MKRQLFVGTLAMVCLAGAAQAQITGSKHDFSTMAWSGGEICKPCHTPHAAKADEGALWNHKMSEASYTMFEGETGGQNMLDQRSRLCMGCHDGTVALDSFGKTTGINFIASYANIGTDLQDDHPIGADAIYPTGTSTRFNAQNASHQIPGPWGNLRLRAWIDPSDSVEKYVVSCGTCHNVHNAGNFGHMLTFSNQASHVCLTCHIK